MASDLETMAQKNADAISGLTKKFDDLVTKLSRTPANGTPNPNQVLGPTIGVPNVRYGEDSMSSRGFSFMKMMGLITGAVNDDDAKTELDIHNRLHNIYVKELGSAGYGYAGKGRPGQGNFLAPLSTGFMHEKLVPRDFRAEMKSLTAAGTDGADLDHMRWIRKKHLELMGYSGQKALSWLYGGSGGDLVAPPEFGELIELLRNKEALVNAGARVVPLPPQGRMKFPRQTSASLTYWIGENAPIPESQPGVGEVTLQAKKLAVLIKAPNELIRFASPAAEALIRDDMTKSLALGLDLSCLEGAGSDNQPRGIINDPGINLIGSSDARPNGDRLVPEDAYRMVAGIEEVNAEMEGFIMRPKTLYKYYQIRADAIAQGDKQGMFLFNLIREPSDGMNKPMLAGFPVTKSTQVSQVRSKGSASNLTYIIGGMWSDFLIGMFGAMEFAASTHGDAFLNDQSWLRGILTADTAVRHAAAFVWQDNLDLSL